MHHGEGKVFTAWRSARRGPDPTSVQSQKVAWTVGTEKSFEYGKCPETGKRKNSLNTEGVWKQGNSKILWTQKMSGNRENRKILLVQKTWLTRGTIRPLRFLDSYTNSVPLQTKLKTTSFVQPQNKPNDMGVTDSGKQQNRLHQQKRDSRGAPTDIGYGKCPETRKWQNPLLTREQKRDWRGAPNDLLDV